MAKYYNGTKYKWWLLAQAIKYICVLGLQLVCDLYVNSALLQKHYYSIFFYYDGYAYWSLIIICVCVILMIQVSCSFFTWNAYMFM